MTRAGILLAALLVSVLLLPSGGAETATSPVFVEAVVSYERSADLEAMEEVFTSGGAADPLGDCQSEPGGEHEGRFSKDPAGQWFRFRETDRQNGCGEARFELDVPERATLLKVQFHADRVVEQTQDVIGRVDHVVDQELVLYGDMGEGLEAIYRFPYYEPDGPPSGLQRFEYLMAIPPNATDLGLAWFFQDTGASLASNAFNVLVGHHVSATVVEPRWTFSGVPLDRFEVSEHRDGIEGQSVVRSVEVLVDFPDHRDKGLAAWLDIAISNTFSIGRAMVGDEARVKDDLLLASEEDGVLRLRLSPQVTDQHGAGPYTVSFRSAQPLESTPVMLPLLIAAVAAPAATGWMAQKNVVQLDRKATGLVKQTAYRIRTATFLVWLAYAGLLGVVFVSGFARLMAAWPMEPEQSMAYLLLMAMMGGFLALSVIAKRQLVVAMEEEADERQQMLAELERSNKELEQFAYVASHDLQEPLRMVASYTRMLERRYKGKLDDDADEFIGYAVEGAGRMQALINALLAYSRVGSQGLQIDEVPLGRSVQTAMASLRGALEQTGAVVQVGEMPTVRGDGRLLAQLFQNLIGNAIKFSGDAKPQVRVSAKADGRRWRIEVQDNGIGIEPQHQERIFQIFQRLHGRSDFEGTGIGLALCRKIVEQHGGTIGVTSKPGHGSTFHFTLPA
ncbi:MAG: sensor histidine kinase [Thermoplasmatota archaeon]